MPPYCSALSLARSAQAERDNESCFFMRAASVHRFIRRYHIKTSNLDKLNDLSKVASPNEEGVQNVKIRYADLENIYDDFVEKRIEIESLSTPEEFDSESHQKKYDFYTNLYYDSNMRKDFEKRMKGKDLPTFDDFIKFLENELRILESTAHPSSAGKDVGAHRPETTNVPQIESNQNVLQRVNALHSMYSGPYKRTVLLQTAMVQVMDSCGQFRNVRALLDTGSQSTFISESCARRSADSRYDGYRFDEDYRQSSKLFSPSGAQNEFRGLNLADERFYESRSVELLIGSLDNLSESEHYIIPHHGIFKSGADKIRVVLMRAPDEQRSLVE
ncbi:hypothetical protein EVAR_48761_1 [Eumeta japonica]|uniref:Peptidase A2 domain-containing protein n=1 Tax=Eumeta variegata TaxID=151549 RepID=A0A4C1YJ59_EUMVA|nr:hypothetical protein EVAR_48761_1 [Eumeta japonica]